MQFEKGYIYHIYNQGNNKQKIFFERENYLFFLRKIRTHILPYADILAWALMPNHFHLMVYVRECQSLTQSEPLTGDLNKSQSLNSSQSLTERTLNESIGIMLRTYTRAINKQKNRTGSLFKEHTKAICLNSPNEINPLWFTDNGITKINIQQPEKQYPQICFDYIHQNPTKAKLVQNTTAWEYSSAKDYAGLRNGKLVNKKLANKYLKTS